MAPPSPTRSERPRSTRTLDFSRSPTLSRPSVLSSVVPYLRRASETADDMAAHHKSVLLTLKFSSPSFLDSVVSDDTSPKPLYVIRTTGTSTSVLRTDAWDAETKTAEIKWPRVIPTKGKTRETLGVLVQLSDGRWQSGDTILKPGNILSAPPRFHIPNFSHSMRWKRVGNSYWCMTSTVKGPIATFHPAVEGVPPRIKVFETLQDKYDSRPMPVHNSVSILLIDHLIVTAMLLVTDVQEWMLVKKYEGHDGPSIPPLSAVGSELFEQPPQSAPASASQWRKILYGEPMFPKRYPNSRTVSTTDLSAVPAPLPTSAKQMAKIVYGDPIYPSLSPSPVNSAWDSDDEDEDEDLEAWRAQRGPYNASLVSLVSPRTPPTRAHSPSAESTLYPLANVKPPSHTYMDPSFYGENVPPVPQIPAQYASSSSSSRGTTPPDSARLRAARELPLPPTPMSPSLPRPSTSPSARSQSTPPRHPSEPPFLAAAMAPEPLEPTPARSRSRSQSMKLRQLPTPPSVEDVRRDSRRDTRQSQMSMASSTSRTTRRSSVYSQRSLPVPPGAPGAPPLPVPRRKDPEDELWMYSWTNAAAGPRAPQFEAPPPYMEVSDSPTSSHFPDGYPGLKRQSTTYHS